MRTIFTTQLEVSKIYKPEEVMEVIYKIGYIKPYKDNKKVEWFDIPMALDIETSSFKDGEHKYACMYIWTLSICGFIVQGRRWSELVQTFEQISQFYELNIYRRCVVYIHNLAYEFQFMRKYFVWDSVFALSPRKPIYGLTSLGIEFRCSYLLSGYSLARLAENIHSIKIRKLVGDLDYDKIRTWLTPLTDEELQYCINDVQIIIAYVFDLFEQGYNLSSVPKLKQVSLEFTPVITVFTDRNMGKTKRFI